MIDEVEARKKWLASLKVGSEVAHKRSGYGGGHEIRKIEKISPTGIITVGSYTFRPDGHVRGGSYRTPGMIYPVTPEIREEFEVALLRTHLTYFRGWNDLSAAKLRAIKAILDAKDEHEPE